MPNSPLGGGSELLGGLKQGKKDEKLGLCSWEGGSCSGHALPCLAPASWLSSDWVRLSPTLKSWETSALSAG